MAKNNDDNYPVCLSFSTKNSCQELPQTGVTSAFSCDSFSLCVTCTGFTGGSGHFDNATLLNQLVVFREALLTQSPQCERNHLHVQCGHLHVEFVYFFVDLSKMLLEGCRLLLELSTSAPRIELASDVGADFEQALADERNFFPENHLIITRSILYTVHARIHVYVRVYLHIFFSPDFPLQRDPLGREAAVDEDSVDVVSCDVQHGVVLQLVQWLASSWKIVKLSVLHRLLNEIFDEAVDARSE